MSFRRNREAERAWRKWVHTHEAELIAIGVPREVWAEEMDWWRFVEHSHHPPVSNARDVRFNPADLSDEHQLRLYRVLNRVLPEVRYRQPLWWILHNRFGATNRHPRLTLP